MIVPWKKSYEQPRQHIKSRDITNKVPSRQSYIFSTSHLQIQELHHKEGSTLKNWCFQIVVLKTTLQSPLDCKQIKPVNPKGNKPGIFTGRTDAEAEAPILWPPDSESQLIEKDPDAWRD